MKRRRQIEVEPDFEPFLGGKNLSPLQARLNEIIFGYETKTGRIFDIALMIAILISVITVMLESVASIQEAYGNVFWTIEWILTVLFTIEYVTMLYCFPKPSRYAMSFFGIVDLLSILPTYVALFITGTQSLIVIRALRLLRVFRVLKIAHCLREATHLWIALRATQSKILVFLVVVMNIILIMGSAMYLIEGPENGFTSIPKSVYWAIVTMTTVGYGDIAPQTVAGQTMASVAMILGYGIIIVPTGVFSVEIVAASRSEKRMQVRCTSCTLRNHESDSVYCRRCGAELPLKDDEDDELSVETTTSQSEPV